MDDEYYETIKLESNDSSRYSVVIKELIESVILWETLKGNNNETETFISEVKTDLLNLLVREVKFQLTLQEDFTEAYRNEKLKLNKQNIVPITGGK